MRTTHATAALLVALACSASAPAQRPGGHCLPPPQWLPAPQFAPAPPPATYYHPAQSYPLPAPAHFQWAGPVQYVQQQPAPAAYYWHAPQPLQACPGGVCRPGWMR